MECRTLILVECQAQVRGFKPNCGSSLGAVSVAGAVLMIEELNRPLEGLMRISSVPVRYALAHLGK